MLVLKNDRLGKSFSTLRGTAQRMSTRISIHMSIRMSIRMSIHMCIDMSIRMSIRRSIRMSIYMFIPAFSFLLLSSGDLGLALLRAQLLKKKNNDAE